MRNVAARAVTVAVGVVTIGASASALGNTWTSVNADNGAGSRWGRNNNWDVNAPPVAGGEAVFSDATLPAIIKAVEVVTNSGSPITAPVGKLRFTGAGWQVTLGTLSLENLAARPVIDVAASGSAAISTPLTSSVGFDKLGTGTLTLSGANTLLSGPVNVDAGTLLVSGSISSATTTVKTGGTIRGL